MAAAAQRKPTPPKRVPDGRPGSPKGPKVRERFLAFLRQGMQIGPAANKAGTDRRTVYRWRADDEEFAKLWDDAYDEGTDLLEQEAQRRASEGYEEVTTFDGPKGSGTTVVRKYSDTLMSLMLQGRRPQKYRKSAVELSGPDGGPINATLQVEFVGGKK